MRNGPALGINDVSDEPTLGRLFYVHSWRCTARPPYLGDGGRSSLGRLPTSVHGEQVALVLHPLEDLLEAQVLQRQRVVGTRLDLVPGARGRDHRQLAPAQ